jgi:putative ABC transport system permease protein
MVDAKSREIQPGHQPIPRVCHRTIEYVAIPPKEHVNMMIHAALRHLQSRRRRFLVAALGAGLVLALSTVMTGITASFNNEAVRTVALAQADHWLVPTGAAGPFTTTRLIDEQTVHTLQTDTTLDAVAPILVTRQSVVTTGAPRFSILMGVEPGRLGAPHPSAGAPLDGPKQAIADTRLDVPVGSTLTVAGTTFNVVGTVRSSLFAATPVVFVGIDDARQVSVEGAKLSSAVLVRGAIYDVPAGLKVMTSEAAVADAMEPLKSANQTLAMVRTLLWLVAMFIVGSALYLNALERTKDFAIFKAIGTSSRAIAGGLVVQALVVALLASAVAAALAFVLAPRFPMTVEISKASYLTLPLVALVVALLGAAGGMRRAVTLPPSLAFGASS